MKFTNGYALALHPEIEEGYSVFESTGTGDKKVYGITKYYPFKIKRENISGSSSFEVLVPSKTPATFSLSNGTFIVPSLTTFSNRDASVVIAVPVGENVGFFGDLSVIVAAPVPQPLTLAPVIQTGQASWKPGYTSKDDFVLRTAVYDVGQTVTGGVGVKLVIGESIVDTLILDAGVAGW